MKEQQPDSESMDGEVWPPGCHLGCSPAKSNGWRKLTFSPDGPGLPPHGGGRGHARAAFGGTWGDQMEFIMSSQLEGRVPGRRQCLERD